MRYTLLVLPLLSSLASAQEDLWKTLALGDRVQVTFRSGNMITGELAARPGDPKVKVNRVDYTQTEEVTINLSLEYPGLNGTMTLLKKEIKAIRKLQALDANTRKRMEEERDKYLKQAAADEAKRKEAEGTRDKEHQAAIDAIRKEEDGKTKATEVGGDLVKKAERLKKGMELLGKFPPPAWGTDKLSEIGGKTQRRLPVTPDEREFLQNYDLWKEALDFQKGTEKGPAPKEEKAPEKKT